jgi:eukaryotic-like serine/threonine-protein kinase
MTQTGVMLGNFLLLGRLARGGTGDVYLARKLPEGGVSALKFLRADMGTAESLARFHHERRLAPLLTHPNLCRGLDVGEVMGVPYLSLEYVAGVPLWRLQQRLTEMRRVLPPAVAFHVARAVLSGLQFAHDLADDGRPLGVVHRDISPQNILLGFDGSTKLIDFGLARSAWSTEEQGTAVHGTLAYMAPEQAAGESVDARADQYALAVVLYELLVGERFWGGLTNDQIMMLRARGKYRPAGAGALSPGVAAVLGRALADRVDQRFPSCAAFAHALGDVVSGTTDAGGLVGTMRAVLADEMKQRQDAAAKMLAVSA